jgi:NAD(P)-dependent dehydrogenase (short-subunit alcohol dehydrogenase family)
MGAEGYLDGRANLAGRKAVVIGGGYGVGRGVSLGLAGAGVDLAICDNNPDALAATAEKAARLGVKVISRVLDATFPAELSAFYDVVAEAFGDLQILVNVVGGVKQALFMETGPDRWQDDIQRNFGYVLESIHRAVPMMQRGGRGGSIVNFTTIEAHRGAASLAVYAGAKAALTNFTRALAVELGPHRIRVNTLAPDSTPESVRAGASRLAVPAALLAEDQKLTPEQWSAGRRMYIPLGSAAEVEDIANGVLFLASDLAAFVTGATLHVDGGTHAASGFLNWPQGVGYLPAARGKALAALFPDA